MDKTEQKNIERILNGDTEIFGVFIRTYSKQIFTLIWRIVRNQEDAEELTQDCFLKAYNTLNKFKGECLFSTWLYRIAYNTAISATRKRKQEFLHIEEQMINQIPDHSIDEQFKHETNENQLAALNKAINCLPPEERALLQLFYTEQKNVEDIATITGLTPANVKVKLHRIRKKLYIVLNNEWYNLV